ncbi:uncharacterized protein [Penaeus vannamei]|uniref:uncharacterized protein isoform X2 n=2 Tax=Penaeus vannamei TaxID=6689 RepID=UPI00387F9656
MSMNRMMKISLMLIVCVLVVTTLSAFVQRFGSSELPPWVFQAQMTALFFSLAFVAFSSACSLGSDLSKITSSAFERRNDVIMVDLLTNKIAVSFFYSACWVPILLYLASKQVIEMLEDFDAISPAGEVILRYHCAFLRHIPVTSVQTLALSALVLPKYRVGSTGSAVPEANGCWKAMIRLALCLPILSRLILYMFVLPEKTGFRHTVLIEDLPSSFLFCDVAIDEAYLEVARFEMFLTLLICLTYSALHLPRYLERVFPQLTQQLHQNASSEKGTSTEHRKTTDVVGSLALYWTVVATPLLLIHVQVSGHEEWTSCLTLPSHFLLLFATSLLLNGSDLIYAEVMEAKGQEEEEEDDAKPLWLLDEKGEEEVGREKGEKEKEGTRDVYPLWFHEQEIEK